MHRILFKTAALLAAMSVILGAFGAHALKDFVSVEDLNSAKTGINYQMFHSIAIFIAGMNYRHYPNKKILWASYFFVIGIILFSGSLYAIVLLKTIGIPINSLIAILTPLGGISFVLGWLCMFMGIPSDESYTKKPKQ
jgi:uncharacterized membrane protein YgdD (TMEM256/DUF423 family)